MAIEINIPKPVIDYNDLDNKPTLVTDHSQLNLDDGTNPHGTTANDVGAYPNPTGTTSQYIRGDGSLETFPSIPDVTGLQSKPVVVSSNTTAQNDTVYHVVANATFTDPSPIEGRGYLVFVRNGTATIGGVGYTESILVRIFHLGSWLTRAYIHAGIISSTFVSQNRTINGLNLTADRTLTTANINDSVDRRYVTDAQLSVIGNTSGTNTGDQDLSGFVAKSQYSPAHSVLAQQSGTSSPSSVQIGTNQILGRLSGGGSNIKGLSVSEVSTLLGLSGYVPTSRNLTINGVTQDLSADRSFSVGLERRSDFVSPYHYSGSAPIGTANSGTWTIKRVDFTNFGAPATLTATGSWNDRYTLIYA